MSASRFKFTGRGIARPRANAEGEERRQHMQRLAQSRAERQRLLDARRSEEAAALVALARAERAKRIAAGKVVAPSYEEWKEGCARTFTAMGDLA